MVGVLRFLGHSKSKTRLTHYGSFPKEKYGEETRLISKGATSHVYLYARDGQLFAVKQFRPRNRKRCSHRAYMAPIEREASIHGGFPDNEHIAKFFEAFSVSDDLYIVLEYLPYSLQRTVTRFSFTEPIDLRKCFFRQLVEGAAFVNDCNISHRDLKPLNVCIDSNGTLKIIDFGSAVTGRTAEGLAGSKIFSAPEMHYIDKYEQVSCYDGFKADSWSLGICFVRLYYCCHTQWTTATMYDTHFNRYWHHPSIGNLLEGPANVPDSPEADRIALWLLNPNPQARPAPKDLLSDPWILSFPKHTTTTEHSAQHAEYLR